MTDILLIPAGLIIGVLAAILGVGGGIMYVPTLTALFGFAQKDAQGTSLAVIAPAALFATIANARARRVEWRTALLVAIGAVVGAIGGSQAAQRLDDDLLRKLFAVLLVFSAIRMLLRLRTV